MTANETKIAIIGYGSQGRAHALNLHESGFDVVVGVREGGAGHKRATQDGLPTASPADAAAQASLIAMLTPDLSHEEIFQSSIVKNLSPNDALLFAHGFTVHYGQIKAPAMIDVILVAPKGPGDLVRREYQRGRGVPCLFAVHQDATGTADARAQTYAAGIGGAKTKAIKTSFAEETETDLFGEQAVLCGGVTELITAGFDTLVDAGYQPEVAYYECLHELKLIVDLLYEGGLSKMHKYISETAIYGDLTAGPHIINNETRNRMREILSHIQKGNFAKEWISENQAGKPKYQSLMQQDMAHPIEQVGARLRADMAWLNTSKPSAE